jgi:putative ABC transport system ATP-binding protein
MDVVRTVALFKNYRLGKKVEVPALNGVDISIGEGEFVAVMGPSGCGKTTFLHLVGGLDRPSAGQVLVDGSDLAAMSDAGRTRMRREKVGFIFQRFNLIPTLSAAGNLALAARIKGLDPKSPALAKLLDLVGIGHKAAATPLEMSIGEQQRAAVARALVGDPRLMLADEPTGSLDSENSTLVLKLFAELNRTLGQTLVMVTHSEEAATYAHRVIRMRDGRVLQ